MTVVLPYPDKPANGQTPDATPILANLIALLNAINAFDGANINAKSVQPAALADSINPQLRDAGAFDNFIESGGWTSTFTGLGWSMPGGVEWYDGVRNSFPGAGYSVAINQDTYYSVHQSGAVNAPQAVANNAAAPALPALSQWLAKVVSGGAAITSIADLRNPSPTAGTVIARAARTGSMTGFSAETDSSLSLAVYTPGNYDVELTIDFPQILSSVSGDRAHIRLKQDGAEVGGAYVGCPANGWAGRIAVILPTPAAGIHTYTYTVQRDIGTGTLTVFADTISNNMFAARLV